MADFSTFISTLSEDPAARGKQFERVCKWFLENDSIYRHQLKRIWLWEEWLGRRHADAGIDLVAETMTGELWAIQSKAYDPQYNIRKADLDSFLSESSRPEFSYRLLIATTDGFGPTAERTLAGQEKPVGRLLRADLLASQVEWPRSYKKLLPARKSAKKPRPHQREAIKNVVKGFEHSDRGQLIMACGTGKTVTSMYIAKALDAKRVLVLTPSISLLKDTVQEWTANFGDFEFIPVCSDDTVSPGDDAAVETLSQLGYPVTTDGGDIAAFLHRRGGGPQIVFSTYQSSPRVAEAFGLGRRPDFDLVVCDEAHRTAGPVSSDFATVLDAAAIRAKRRLFMTATPRYFTGRIKKAATEAEFEIASMDDESKFGVVFHRLSFATAIEKDLLSDYQVAVIGVTDELYKEWVEEGRYVTVDGKNVTDARSLAGQIGLLKAIREFDLRRIISFHSRVHTARRFAESITEILQWMPADEKPTGDFWGNYVSGGMSAGERSTRLDRLRQVEGEERGLLSNPRCLSEGIDVPSLDGVAFIEPRRSEVDIIQAVGRAIRKSDKKKVGTIVIPVFLGSGDDAEDALNSSVFKPVWDVVRALRAHDEDLAERLDTLRRERGRLGKAGGDRHGFDKIHVLLPTGVGEEFVRAFDVALVDSTTASWEFWYGLLQRYVEREGDARVSTDHMEGPFKLGLWASGQRHRRRRGELSPDRVERLSSLYRWSWDPKADQREEGFCHLEAFARREGHCDVPVGYEIDGFKLRNWIGTQRTSFNKYTLPDADILRFEALPGWTWKPIEDQWEDYFRLLQVYVEREGHARVPQAHIENHRRLGSWITNQRNLARNGKLAPSRSARLESFLGWTWDTRESQWEEGYAALEAFSARNGHCRVPQGQVESSFKLGTWVAVQRSRIKANKLSADRVARLEALPGWVWNSREAQWEEGYEALQAFIERNGHCRIPEGHMESGVYLQTWVSTQLSRYRSGKLPPDRAARLETLSGWTWNVSESQWEKAFGLLRAFVKREGHARVPAKYQEDGFSLGAWVTNQRQSFNSGILTGERVALLEAQPGWSWKPFDDQWEAAFAVLMNFVEQAGHCAVPRGYVKDGVPVGKWIVKQRQSHRRGHLTRKQASRLEALPGWTWDSANARKEAMFAALDSFVAREGHARVPDKFVEGGKNLGSWVVTRRQDYRKGNLSPETIARLEAYPGWTWVAQSALEEKFFDHLDRFVARTGHAGVPQTFIEDGYRLGALCNSRRQDYRKGRLSPEIVRRLESYPRWRWDPRSEMHDEFFSALDLFVAREGHARVPGGHIENGFELGKRCTQRRSDYRKGHIAIEVVARLEEYPGWTWDYREANEESKFAAMDSFVAREGHARVKSGHQEGDVGLGSAVSTWRQEYTKGDLPLETIARLEAYPGWTWEPHKSQEEKKFVAMDSFVAREGHSRVPPAWVEGGLKLGVAVSSWRSDYRTNQLPPETTARLETFPGWTWHPLADRDKAKFVALDVFVAREGHAKVPSGWSEGDLKLGNAVMLWRKSYRDGKLTPEIITRLQSYPGWTWDSLADLEAAKFAAMDAFVAREGHARVPQQHVENGFALGSAVTSWRGDFRRGQLRDAVIARLESYPGWTWEPRADRQEAKFKALDSFVAREGHARVPQSHVECGLRLGSALNVWRGLYRQGRLNQDVIVRLEKYPEWTWDPLATSEAVKFAALDKFVAREGHARVPAKHIEGELKLGAALHRWRQAYKKGMLPKAIALRLESYPGWTWSYRNMNE